MTKCSVPIFSEKFLEVSEWVLATDEVAPSLTVGTGSCARIFPWDKLKDRPPNNEENKQTEIKIRSSQKTKRYNHAQNRQYNEIK